MIQKTAVKSCCGSVGYVFNLKRAIQKSHLPVFSKAGFGFSPAYTKSGIFYIQKSGLTATGGFGTKRLQIRCSGTKCKALVGELEGLIIKALNGEASRNNK